jgi:drug/metabolite transporter (DMT)-like permease
MDRAGPSRPDLATGRRTVAAATSEPVQGVPRAAVVLIAAISVLWGLNWPIMKVAVTELSPWTFRTVCVVISGVGLMLLAWASGESLSVPRRQWRALLIVSVFSVTGWHLFSAFSLVHMGGGRGAIVAYTMPIWAALFSAWYLKERPTRRRLTALVVGMAGILFLIGPDLLGIGHDPLGPMFMIGAAICWAAGIVTLKGERWQIGIMALTGWQLLLGGIPIVLAWLVVEPHPDLSRLTWAGGLATLYAATVALIFCFAAHNKVVTLLPATAAAISTLAIPVVGLLSSAWLLGEPIGWRDVAALVLVLASIALVLLPEPKNV